MVFAQLGYSLDVIALAISPNGQILAGSDPEEIKFWDATSGRELLTIGGNFQGISFSPNGRLLASAGWDNTIRLWDAVDGHEVRALTGHSNHVRTVAFSSDGRTLASGGDDGTVRLWDFTSGRMLRALRASSGINSVAFSPDGRILASGSSDKTVKLWDVASGGELRTFSGHSSIVWSVAFSPDGRILASGSEDKTVKLWDVLTGREIATLAGNSNRIASVAFSPNGRMLATGSWDQSIKLWDVTNAREVLTINGHSGRVTAVAFSAGGNTLASGSSDRTIKFWDVASGKLLRAFAGHSAGCARGVVSPDGRTLAMGCEDRTVRLWDVASAREVSILNGHSNSIYSVAFSPDGRILASGSSDKTVKLWDVASGREQRTLSGHSGPVQSVAFSPDGRILASGSSDKTVKLWDVASGRELRTFSSGHSVYVNSVAFSPNGQILASGSYDGLNHSLNRHEGTITLWDVKSGQVLNTLDPQSEGVNSVAFSPDGHLLASGSFKTVKLWDVANGREIRSLAGYSSFKSVAFSPNGQMLAAGDSDKTIKLWEVASGRELRTLTGHSGWVESVAFAPDGVWLASASLDGTARVWDFSSGRQRVELIGFTDGSSLAITPEGYYDVSAASAEENLNVRVGNRVFPIAAYRDTFYRPDLVKLSLAGNSLTNLGFAGIDSVKVAPVVGVVDLPPSTSEPRLTVNVQLTDGGGGIGRVVLFHNGTAIQDSPATGSLSQPGESITRSFSVDLVDGPNFLQVEAYNAANTMRSDSAIGTVAAKLPPKNRSSLHAVVVGIQEFKNPNFNLAYPTKDAQLFADTLSKYSEKLFQNIDIKLLITPADTTRDSIVKALKDVQGAVGPDDLFVFYVASHGITDDAEYYLITSNVGSVSTEHLKTDAVSKEELTALVANIHATKKLMVIDTCHAEALGNALQVGLLTRGLDEATALKILSRAVGTTVLAASTSTQQALEGYEGHGLFTYVVAQGLMGKGDVDNNGIVNTLALAHYVDAQVPDLAQRQFNHKQYPTIETNGQAFPLTAVR